jgi:class 3 adenylate cyclase
VLVCPHCSFENSPTAAFCVNCGRSLTRPQRSSISTDAPARPASEAERRFVTVLFADLSGFTALLEKSDPETVREHINACFDRLVPIVESHQGMVDQFVGDGILALFGAPVAHEDDPVQACRAALDMMQAIENVNAERNLSLGLHIGINSGMVLAGGMGSRGRQQYSVLGDAVNLGSRLEDAAERGEIFVGAETYRLTRDHFEFVSRGTMPFKGKSEPQAVWQLQRARPQAPTHRRIHTATPLLGRERELALLKRVTRELLNDDAGLRVVSILGDAGLGKSRLVQEWRDLAIHSLAPVPPHYLLVACVPDSATRAYALIAELARTLLYAYKDTRQASGALEALLGIGASAQNLDSLDDTALQAQYTNALRELIARYATNDPWVIVCEDLHWADAPSVRVLQRALAQSLTARVLIGFTSRLEPETPGWELMQTTEELPGVAAVRIHLAPLAENDAHALLVSLIPGSLPPDVEELILTQAEGNPLFVEELVRMLLDRGDLKRENDRWILARERLALDVPNTLQGVLMARVDQLPPDARRVLQIASVLGREFPMEVLEHMLQQTK